MNDQKKSQSEILEKLNIEQLNEMQIEALSVIGSNNGIVLLSPTGTGKTLAFLLPIIENINEDSEQTQVLILVPSRELAIQIEQVLKEMGTGYKVNAVYGGRMIMKDKELLGHPPSIIIGTPGRVADHIRRGNIKTGGIKTLVLDEFDKSLEVGFTEQMTEIIDSLENVEKRILTSATQGVPIPDFVGLRMPKIIDYSEVKTKTLQIKSIISPGKDKLETLGKALKYLGSEPGIVFCNFRDSIERVSEYLNSQNIDHGCFHGGMEQHDRERALIKFRNGTYQLIVATDLAARGIDVPEIKFIIHYHLPTQAHEFTHRNGRTARMHQEGTAYVIKWAEEELPDFIGDLTEEEIELKNNIKKSKWSTLFVSGGRKDKISKGDIAGFFLKKGELKKDELGVIELLQECSFVAVPHYKLKELERKLNNQHLKKRKVRVYEV